MGVIVQGIPADYEAPDARARRLAAERARRYRERHPDRSKAIQANYRSNNPEACQRAKASWYKRNRQHVAEKSKEFRYRNPDYVEEYFRKNKDRLAAAHAAWWAANVEKARLYSHRRRALKMAQQGTVSSDIVITLFRFQDGECVYCPADLVETGYHLDHRMPLAKGGLHDDSNLQLLCPSCNRRKSDKSPEEFEAVMDRRIPWGS